MQSLPKSWQDVFYLTRKEVNKDPELPNLSMNDVERIHMLFWKQVLKTLKDRTKGLQITGLVVFYPKKRANEQYEKTKQKKRERLQSDPNAQ